MPRAVGRLAVRSVREEWLVEDGWWTGKSLQRHYFELVLEDGSDVVVFRTSSDPSSDGLRYRAPSHQRASSQNGRWYRQRD
jgi:hypothetical protein